MNMKKRLLSALAMVVLVAQLIGCMPAAAAPTSDSPSIPKFLLVGNSYSVDAMNQFHNVLKAEGVTEYTIGYLFYSGCTLNKHVSHAQTNANAYRYFKAAADSNGWVRTLDTSMLTALQDEPWDYVFLQQASGYSARPDSYNADLDYLMKYARQNVSNPDVKLGWHMTWSYAEAYKDGKTYSEHFTNDFQASPQLMYEGIASTVQSKILSRSFSCVVPSGTAIQNVRSSYIGDTLNDADGQHLNNLGDLIASYCWYATLTGKPLDTLLYAPSSLGLTPKDKQVIIEAVNNTLKNPYAVTPSAYPSTKAITLAGGGHAEVNGERVTEAPKDATVTLRYTNTSKCAQFNGWEVRQGNVTLADPASPVTTFVMPDEKVSIRANVTYNCPALRMTDVSSTGWYHNAVDYALNNGIMSGYDESTFGTDDTLTRAQVVQVLYNKEGKPAVTAENQFNDVPADQWYFDAVRWAADKGVVSGVGDGNFNPNGKITLEQAAVILHNYSGKPAASAELNAIGNYSSWAADALRWSVANGLLKDIPFENATDAATRAQTAQILYNYLSK